MKTLDVRAVVHHPRAAGDVLIVTRLDRLAGSTCDLLKWPRTFPTQRYTVAFCSPRHLNRPRTRRGAVQGTREPGRFSAAGAASNNGRFTAPSPASIPQR